MAQFILSDDIIKTAVDLFKVTSAKALFEKIPAIISFIEKNYASFKGVNKKQLVLQIIDSIGNLLPQEEQTALKLIEPAIEALIDEIVSLANSSVFKQKVKKCFSCFSC